MPAAIINSALEAVHDQSLPTIGLLQQSFPDSYAFMINISVLFDPRYVFLIYAPILFALNKQVGHRMIVALTCCEWSNQVLKWLLAGERPYWYVHERLDKLTEGAPSVPEYLRLKQFPVTCELGAGSPSGHAMVTATVWYILIDAYLKGELKLFEKNGPQRGREDNNTTATNQETTAAVSVINRWAWLTGASNRFEGALARPAWTGYFIILVLVGVSRVYLACHFPHQCLCGALLGFALAKLIVDKLPMEQLKPWHFCLATMAMFASAMATYAILKMRGFDPLWSVSKAMRWCEKPEHIHLDTTPFYSMMRYLGFCLGAGLAYDSSKLSNGSSSSNDAAGSQLGRLVLLVVRRVLVVALSIGFGQLLLAIPLTRSNLNLYYAISFMLYTIFAYSFAALIPDFVKSVLPISVNFQVQTSANSLTAASLANGAQPIRKKKISIKKLS
uniref:glucose-6-phosphatase n=1 Tax=Aceria tosichella TaxID=561515 RepID=A0A6G1SC34_9ACAR